MKKRIYIGTVLIIIVFIFGFCLLYKNPLLFGDKQKNYLTATKKEELWYENKVEKMIKRGDKIDKDENTILHYVAATENIDLAASVLNDYDLDINHKNDQGQTPIFWSVEHNCLDMLTYLLSHGADKDITDAKGKTACDYAMELGYESLATTFNMIIRTTILDDVSLLIELEEIKEAQNWINTVDFLLKPSTEEMDVLNNTESILTESDAIEVGVNLFNANNKDRKGTDYNYLTIYHDIADDIWIFYYGMDLREELIESGGFAYAIRGVDGELIKAWAEE